MRWFRSPDPPGPSVGDTRFVSRFLWWPLELLASRLNKEQVRWLERATIYQEYISCPTYDDRSKCRWRDISFLDEDY